MVVAVVSFQPAEAVKATPSACVPPLVDVEDLPGSRTLSRVGCFGFDQRVIELRSRRGLKLKGGKPFPPRGG